MSLKFWKSKESRGARLTYAARWGNHSEVQRLLLKANAQDINEVDAWGRTALTRASEEGHVSVVKLLLSARADKGIESRDYGYTAANLAAYAGRVEVLKLLMADGGDIHKQNKDGHTPLSKAAGNGKEEVVKFLLTAGANKNVTDKEGWTALMRASNGNHTPTVKTLVAAGADKDMQNKVGWTALMLASFNDRVEVVKALIAAGASLHLQNKDGKTALDVAKTPEIRDLLGSLAVAAAPVATDATEVVADSISLAAAPVGSSDECTTPQELLPECTDFLQQVTSAPQRRDMALRQEAVCTQLNAAVTSEDFELVVFLGNSLQALRQESAQLPLSEEDYLTLPARHAQLVQRLTDKCKELAKVEEYAQMDEFAAMLESLKAQDIQDMVTAAKSTTATKTLPPPSVTIVLSGGDLITQCDLLVSQAPLAPQRRDLTQRLSALSAQVAAAKTAEDFRSLASLGQSLKATQEESAQLPLSEEDCVALPTRRDLLVKRVVVMCKFLAQEQQYTALAALSAKLKALKALDLGTTAGGGESGVATSAALPVPSAAGEGPATTLQSAGSGHVDDPVLPPAPALVVGEEADSANDPVLPSGVQGTA